MVILKCVAHKSTLHLRKKLLVYEINLWHIPRLDSKIDDTFLLHRFCQFLAVFLTQYVVFLFGEEWCLCCQEKVI